MLSWINRALVVEARCFSTKRSRSYTEGLTLETRSNPKYPTWHEEAVILMFSLTLSALVNDRKYKCIKCIFSTTVKEHMGHRIRWFSKSHLIGHFKICKDVCVCENNWLSIYNDLTSHWHCALVSCTPSQSIGLGYFWMCAVLGVISL